MDTEADDNFKDPGVESLQAVLFPINSSRKSATSPGGFFTNIIFKNAFETNEPKEEEEIVKKDSKELFTVVKDPASAIQPPRWPTECQVLDEKIEHISYVPPTPEPYYKANGKEVQPKPIGEECGTVVYHYYPISAANYFSRSSVGGSRYLLPTCPASEEDTLKFESRFESGNLAKVIRITATYYELHLRTDLYTSKHTQWFYFRVTKTKKNVTYRFSIANMAKNTSLYNEGLKPLMYSVKDARLHSIGWRRCGDNITYFCNENIGPDDPEDMMTYTLTFTIELPHDDDEVYFAYSYPYTYSNLQDHLMDICKHPIKSTFTTLRLLCRTMAGNNVYYITITSPQEVPDKKKRAIVISSRVHPGETPASWMMKGVLDYLTSDCGPAKELREKFIFKIVPMLNPDGVIVGNNRCSLTGRDLNRQYRSVIRESYPSVWYTKLMIRRLIEECGVAMYCDLHAHSRKHNIFIYGCENRKNPDMRLIEQVFPLMLHKNTADKFSFEDCKFKIQKNKEGTGRVVMWMMGICNSYTMEASFCGTVMSGPRSETHFCTQDYEMMGRSFCQTLLDYYDDDPRKERLRVKIIERLHKEGSNAVEPTNISLSDYSSDAGDSSDSSSDEVGHEDYSTSLLVPPPSPAYAKRAPKPKTSKTKSKSVGKSTNPTRKVFHCTTAIFADAFPRHKAKHVSDSDSDSSYNYQKKQRNNQRRRKSKKQNKEPFRMICYAKHSDSEIQISKSPSGFEETEFISMAKFRSHSWHRTKPKNAKCGSGTENPTMHHTTQQLHEVQAKLRSLKSKLWFGAGEGNAVSSSVIPLSWGTSKFCETKTKSKPKRAASAKAQTKSPYSKNNKHEENNAKNKKKHKEKQDKEKTEKSTTKTNKQNGKSEKDARPKRSKIQISIHVKEDIKHKDEHDDGCETNNTKANPKKKKKKRVSLDKKTKTVCKQTSKD